jgi:hypothetical protein
LVAAEASPASVDDPREASSSPPSSVRRTSTTSPRSVIATHTVDRVVIGKMADITADGAIGSGERTILIQLPDLGSVEANWAQNERVLLQEMKTGNPIRDASIDALGNPANNTGFLHYERAVLLREGWSFNPANHLWSPGAG